LRPLKLTIQAFGPFVDKITIPFENLGINGIYLISGVTGSGKTTIFDAICYALFNSSSGTNRGNTTLKSHFAKENVESFVEFEFLFNGEKYTILRHPSYERKKSRGEGYILEQSKAQITLPNGKIIAKTKEVDEYIEELLGLNVSQFSQIALLAQGEFLKLLNADTQTRAEIFRNIFKTWNYQDFQNKLKDKTIFYKNEYENLKNSILQYINDTSLIEENLIALKETYLNNQCFDDLDEFICLLKNQNKKDENSLDVIKNDVLKTEKQIEILQEKFIKIQNKINIQKQKELLAKNLIETENNLKAIEKLKEDSKNNEKRIEELNHEIKKLDEQSEKYAQIQELEYIIVSLEKNLNSKKDKVKTLHDNLSNLKIAYLEHSYALFINTEKELFNSQNKLLAQQEKNNLLSANYQKNYNEYLQIQAGIIAKTLTNKKPCPVCGSINHPNPAKLSNENLTKEFLDNLKNELDENIEKANLISQNASILNEQTKSLKANFEKLSKNFNFEFDKNKAKISNLSFEEEILKCENNIKIENESILNLSNELTANKTKIETLSKDIQFDSVDKMLLYQKNIKKEYETLSAKLKEIEDRFLNIKIEKSNIISQIELLNKQEKELLEIDIKLYDEISNEVSTLKGKLIAWNNSAQEIIIRKTINDKALDSIQNKNKEYNKILNLFTDYKILSDCANGNLKGATRIAFEQYIQGYYLDMVLFEANKRLKIMTQNQFHLLRKKDTTSLQAKTGLDLEVMDFHTFKKRSTKTLSGGESFKAALALALGLSDCISNFSGAMNIEAMFIDEGFGSLDSESLELAMEVIFNLSSNNRLIGIISHIEDLKTKIPNQINTFKTDTGSKLEINF